MSIERLQSAFMASILDADKKLPDGWGERHLAGMHVYRGNYRTALVEALRDAFPKTEEWTGEAAFKQAAINHVIANPSDSWTIDNVGFGFDATCAEFFQQSPEVAELAWLERAMLVAFSAADTEPLDLEEFGKLTADFGEQQWIDLKLEFVPGLAARHVDHNLHAIWQSIGHSEDADFTLEAAVGVFAWREGERGTFRMADADEVTAFDAALAGQNYGQICLMLAGDNPASEQLHSAAMRAGEILGRWVKDGIIAQFHA